MGLRIEYIYGQTSLSDEEKEGLLIPSVSTKKELDEFEQLNIESAIQWTFGKTFNADKLLSEFYIKKIHTKMYGDVWKWAGEFRKSEKNIGVQHSLIGIQLRQLLDDTKYWIANSVYQCDEIAIRFKHRLVAIHCFPNGNGRHSRLMADLIIEKLFQGKNFTWGRGLQLEPVKKRAAYIAALKLADVADLLPLIEFARS